MSSLPSFENGFSLSRPPQITLPLTKYEHTRCVIEINKLLKKENMPNSDSVTSVGQHAENLLCSQRVAGTIVRKIGSTVVETVELR
jgi:hypothetical protein